jgi:hypothetical protein
MKMARASLQADDRDGHYVCVSFSPWGSAGSRLGCSQNATMPVMAEDDDELILDAAVIPLDDQVGGPAPMDFVELTDLQVLGRWAEVMRELDRRHLIWSGKSPLADYAELLVARYYGVEPLKGTNPGYDLVTREKRRVQVKSRRYGPGSKPSHFGEFAEFADERFDDFVGVLFEADFSVRAAYLAPYYWVAERVKPVKDKHRLTIKAVLDEAESLERLDLDQT